MPSSAPTGPATLTSDQIAQIRAAAGAPPLSSAGGGSLSSTLFGSDSSGGAAPAAPATPAGSSLEDTLFKGGGAAPAPAATESKPGYFGRVVQDYADTAKTIEENLTKQPATPDLGRSIVKGFETAGDVAGAAVAPIAEAPGIKQVGEGLNAAGTAIAGQLMKIPAYANFFGKLSGFLDKNPDIAHSIGAGVNLASLGLGSDAAEEGAGAAGDLAKNAAEKASDVVKSVAGDVKSTVGETANKAKLAATKSNQLPTLENAASKSIPIPGDTAIKDPLARYNEHVATEQAALKDAKADTALGKVGSNIGNAFEQVAKMRQQAGKTMADEIEKIGEKPTDVTGAKAAFNQDLAKNGLAYDKETDSLVAGKTSKITDQDRSLLQDYQKKLDTLGPNPTIAELDAFLSRTPDEINVYKAKNNITGTTNGERIIKNNLTQLRGQLDPLKTGKGYLKDYATARKQYSDLSGFLEEGQRFLGKKTAAGDYAKDASLAKSSVQSILNNGKKDWLLKLENLTGYPAIDDATLALQAMKDTNDYRGASLLEQLTQGATQGEVPKVPTTLTAIANHFLGKGLKSAAQQFVGTPIEQTQRFLQSLKKGS